MSQQFLLTFHGRNRPGVLAAITTALAELGGDMTEASETIVHGHFSIIMSVNFPEHRTPDVIRQHLSDVGRPFEMDVQLRPLDPNTPSGRAADDARYFLKIAGRDTPGALRSIAGKLANETIDVVDFYGVRQNDNVEQFTMLMELSVPVTTDIMFLESTLEEFASQSGLQIELEHEDFFAATAHPRSGIYSINPTPSSNVLHDN